MTLNPVNHKEVNGIVRNRMLLIFISLALVFSFSACKGNVEETPEPTPTPLVIDDGLPVLKADVLLRAVNPNIDLAEEEYPYLEVWSDVMYDKFGVDVKVNFFPYYKVLKENPEQLYIYDYLRLEPQDGLLLHDLTDLDISYNIMKSLIEHQGILPVTDYAKNSPYYDNFDKDLINLLTDENGDIWGIPVDSATTIFEARAYKQSWLDNVGLQVPYTVDEFYETMMAFTYEDPDGNGEDDTYGYYGPYNFMFALNDVLKAYGLYNGSTSFIAYNPNTGTIEDSLLSPDALAGLEFIRDLYKQKLLRQSGLGPGVYDSMIPENCGSIYWNHNAEDDVVYATAPLTGPNTDNLVYMTTYGKVYFMLSGTEDPENSFNSFVSLVYGSEEAYLMMKYGIEGRHYEVDSTNRAIILNDRAVTNENLGKITIGSGISVEGDVLLGMMGNLDEYPSDSYRIFYNEIVSDPNYLNVSDYRREQELIYLDSVRPYAYNVPTNAALISSDFVDNWRIKIRDDYSYYWDVVQSVAGERIISVSDALEAYKAQMKILGLQDLIDEANAKLGKTTVNQY
jgi:hypothetical protein